MKLQSESGAAVTNPQTSDVGECLRELDANGNTFAILSKTETDYVQVLRAPDRADYRVEYHDGETDEHFFSPDPLDLPRVLTLFEEFRIGSSGWKRMAPWEPMQPSRAKKGCAGGAALLIVAAVAIAAWSALH